MKKLSDCLSGKAREGNRRYKQNPSNDTFDFLSLIQNWEKIIGAQLAKHTSPLRIQNKSLIILTRHSVYTQQLSYLSEEIRKKIFEFYPSLRRSVNKLQFFTSEKLFNDLDKVPFSQEEISKVKTQKHKYSPHYQKQLQQAKQKYQDIELDDDLMELIISIDIQNSEESS